MDARSQRRLILRAKRLFMRGDFVARMVGVLVLVVGLAATLALARVTTKNERAEHETNFRHSVEQVSSALESRFALYNSVITAGQAVFAASSQVSREDWAEFAHIMLRPDRYPGMISLPFLRYIPGAELEHALAEIRADGAPGFTITPTPDGRPEYCPIVYNQPLPMMAPTLGRDACTRPASYEALMASKDNGETRVTPRIPLVNPRNDAVRDGVILYGPSRGQDGEFTGWVGLPLAIGDVLAGVLPERTLLSVQVSDGDPGPASLMYSTGIAAVPGDLAAVVRIPVAGRHWTLEFSHPPARHGAGGTVLATGAVISLLLCILLWRAGTLRAQAQTLAESMTVALRESEEKYRTIITSLEDAYFEADLGGDLVFFNDALVRTLGYPSRELLGMNNRDYMDAENAEKVYRAFNRVYRTGEPERGLQWEVVGKDGTRRYVEASISLIRDETGEPAGFRGIARDITERRQADERIYHLAHYDALTGLPNRSLFEDRVEQVLKRRWRDGHRAALLFLDLDRFKTVNDSLGHHAGDLLLQTVARRITECVREGDTVCRPGGDEFLVLLADLAEPEDAANVADKILRAVAQHYTIENWEFSVTPSIGIAVIPDDGTDVNTLTRNADTAMYHAKESGRNNFQFFTAAMNENAVERLELEHGLRRALERDELEMYYQPIVDVRTGSVVSAEALLRWNRPGHGVVMPGTFMSVVEQSGLILGIGDWVLARACSDAREWGIPVAVNVSGVQFRQHGLPATVARVLDESGLPVDRLELEMTESVLIQDALQTQETVNELRGMGVRFSIDDFGTGYSSLSYLKRFPIDHVKIDRSFIRDLATDPDDAVIVDAIISMAGSLRLEAIGEGVETVEQREYLRRQGCHLMQGYLFSPPVPRAAFERLLAQGFPVT